MYLGGFNEFQKFGLKISKIGLFLDEKWHFLTRSRKKIGTPTLHENRIRGLENASIDLKIGMHVP